MTSTKYIGMDVHKEGISIAVRNDAGKIVMECVIETKASTILQFIVSGGRQSGNDPSLPLQTDPGPTDPRGLVNSTLVLH